MGSSLDDAVDAMPARQLEELRSRIDRRLQACVLCGADGAVAVKGQARLRGNEVRFSFLACPACIERHRLPEGRATQEATS